MEENVLEVGKFYKIKLKVTHHDSYRKCYSEKNFCYSNTDTRMIPENKTVGIIFILESYIQENYDNDNPTAYKFICMSGVGHDLLRYNQYEVSEMVI